MKQFWLVIQIALLAMMSACSAATRQTPAAELTSLEKARVSITAYLDALSQANYDEAAKFYGGDVNLLQGYNPDIQEDDLPALFERACMQNGFMCLPMKGIIAEQSLDDKNFVFEVEFLTREGVLFEQGACCGDDAARVSPISRFSFRVQQIGELYQVLDLPPYVP
ncbi:MAG: hypothetical protein CVU39_23200 [Chloroflexi bacterium HGW-Chloroflexi-10]|nr:MAG: hypothetical protein CVU39_23200 [Chloroflexi bacterium HGW-Chloroflexi-10]